MPQTKKRSIRSRFKSSCPEKKKSIKKEIKIAKKTKTGITVCQVNCYLTNSPNFIGCYAQDELKTLSIRSLPVYLVVNFDHSHSSGTHWIAVHITHNTLEIFDPLGFNTSRWPNIPHFLLDFLHKYSTKRRIKISNEIQSRSSALCGFYCIYFILRRTYTTFTVCNKFFSASLYKNDDILISFFNKF